MRTRLIPTVVTVIAVLVALVSRVEAQGKTAALPKCEAHKLLVSAADGQFMCASLEDVLSATGCAGVLRYTRSDGLKCLKGSSSSWGAELLLPECSSGALLVSEGFGRWKCVEKRELFPECSSGESMVSEGGGRWKCTELIPRCSSGEELESEGGGRWRCKRRN